MPVEVSRKKALASSIERSESRITVQQIRMNSIKTADARLCTQLGIRLNEKKTRIVKLTELHFLKTRFLLTETGKVRRKMCRKSARRMRRKLKTFRRWMTEGRMTEEDIRTAYESWRGHMRRGNSYRVLRRMDRFYKRLMEKGA